MALTCYDFVPVFKERAQRSRKDLIEKAKKPPDVDVIIKDDDDVPIIKRLKEVKAVSNISSGHFEIVSKNSAPRYRFAKGIAEEGDRPYVFTSEHKVRNYNFV